MAKQKFTFPVIQKPVEKEENLNNIEEKNNSQVGDIISQLSKKKEKSLFEIKYIPRNLIRENKKNNYPKDKVEKLKESILHFGLQQNLTVIYLKNDNEYILEAGHTRTYALDELIKEFENYEDKESEEYQLYLENVAEYAKRGYPCKVSGSINEGISYYYEEEDIEKIPEDVIDSEIRLIITNEIKREEAPATKALNIARLTKLYERKNKGKKRAEQVNINEQIASDLNISKRQVANYKSIGKLIPGLQKAFDENKISLKDGSSYAQLPEEEQKIILALIESGKKVNKEEMDALKKEQEILKARLEKKEQELQGLYSEVRKLEEDKENLATELQNKELPEPVVLPDPEKPVIEKKLKDKEKELERQKQKVKELEKQIESTQNTQKLDAAHSNIIKKDIEVKNAFMECEKAIKKYLKESNELLGISGNITQEDADLLGIDNKDKIEEQKKVLEMLFN